MITLSNHTYNPEPVAATIGFFDGVHRGHRFLLEKVKQVAEARGLKTAAITFGEHPLKTIREDFHTQLITTRDEKLHLLSATGIDAVALLNFTREQSMMSAHDFMKNILHDIYNVQALVIGYDHHFGHDRNEGFDDYVRHGKEIGLEVLLNDQLTETGIQLSSTSVRRTLAEGDVSTAQKILGYNYFIHGNVVTGFQNGRKIGYPTANVATDAEKIVPADGVYMVRIGMADGTRYGMLNIGTRPTLNNGNNRSIEVHLFDFHGDLYGSTLRIDFIKRLRDERKFDTLEQLSQQLAHDEATCREIARRMPIPC